MYLIAIRVCSPHKADVEKAHCCDLYTDPMIQAFHRKLKQNERMLDHALLSRYHGIMRGDLEYKQYKDIKELDEEALLTKLKKQYKGILKQTVFFYWNHRPLTHDKWIRLLRKAGFWVINVKGSLDQLVSAMYSFNVEEALKERRDRRNIPKGQKSLTTWLVPTPGQQSLNNWEGSSS